MNGGAMENRTPDLRIANATLYQLSYDPNREVMCKASDALQQAQKHIEEHLLFVDNHRIVVTKKGKFLSDGLASDLFLLNLS